MVTQRARIVSASGRLTSPSGLSLTSILLVRHAMGLRHGPSATRPGLDLDTGWKWVGDVTRTLDSSYTGFVHVTRTLERLY